MYYIKSHSCLAGEAALGISWSGRWVHRFVELKSHICTEFPTFPRTPGGIAWCIPDRKTAPSLTPCLCLPAWWPRGLSGIAIFLIIIRTQFLPAALRSSHVCACIECSFGIWLLHRTQPFGAQRCLDTRQEQSLPWERLATRCFPGGVCFGWEPWRTVTFTSENNSPTAIRVVIALRIAMNKW